MQVIIGNTANNAIHTDGNSASAPFPPVMATLDAKEKKLKMKKLIAIYTILFFSGCASIYSSTTDTLYTHGIDATISVTNAKIVFQKDFIVSILIENNRKTPITVNTSPDEVIASATKTSGGSYRQKGSRCTISVTQDQDNNGQFDFFSTVDMKILSPKKSEVSFVIAPGKTHSLSFPFSPWGLSLSSIRPTAIPGQAEIYVKLRLLVNREWINLIPKLLRVEFIKKESDD